MDRRNFFKIAGLGAASIAATGLIELPAEASPAQGKAENPKQKMKGHFSMMQISSTRDTICCSYLFRTAGGKVIMVDGGFEFEADNLRQKISEAGGTVDIWFITHPHQDHMGAFSEILRDKRGIAIRKVVYSRCTDEVLKAETWAPQNETDAKRYYKILSEVTEGTDILDLHTTGGRFDIDGIGIKVLGVANPDFLNESYNNNSMIIKFWDDSKSVLILGDAYKECGERVLASYPEWLDCDYIQMAHHGQNGCTRHFYDTVKFRACCWPTPSWVWDPDPKYTWINTPEVRQWIKEKGITENHVSCFEKDWVLK